MIPATGKQTIEAELSSGGRIRHIGSGKRGGFYSLDYREMCSLCYYGKPDSNPTADKNEQPMIETDFFGDEIKNR